jgi:ribose transport system ATP-binding protein
MTPRRHTLETVALRKEYPGTVALRDVSLRCEGGEIRALLGKNGAGKSTLVRLLGGAVQPTSGAILVDGNQVRFRSPGEASRRGIVTVHQELSLIPGLTVAENIFLGRLPRRRSGLIDWRTACSTADALLDELGLALDVRAPAGRFGVAQQQMIEIAKAMSHAPSVLMLDEPTSALAHREADRLFTLLKRLAAKGVVLLYITHRLEEIHRIADAVTVLRNGALVGTIPIGEATPAAIVSMMFGETVRKERPPEPAPSGVPVMDVRGFTGREAYRDISFTLHRGEILGIAGVLGAGRTELLRGLFGADPHEAGSVTVDGTTVSPSSPFQMKKLGVALAPEDRKTEGLVQILSTRLNINLAAFWPPSLHRITTARRERGVAMKYIRTMDIAVPSVDSPVSDLSGGNQQKVVIAKWLNTGPRVLLLDEPTRGIDMQAKQQVFDIVRGLSAQGISSIVVSSELEELMEVCHRILILKKGKMTAELLPHDSTLENLISACME